MGHKKADLFQQKEAKCHKHNYDWCSKALSLRMGHGPCLCQCLQAIQSRWKSRENVVEWQPYPNLPVYVVHPIDGEGYSCTLHRNYLLPISSNLEQGECESSVGENGQSGTPIPMPHDSDTLLVNCQTEGWPGSVPNSPSKQCEPFDPGLTSMDPRDEGLWVDNHTPFPLRQSSRMMRNQPQWSYQNLALWQNDIIPVWSTMWRHIIWAITDLLNTNDSWLQWAYHSCWLYGELWMGGVDQRIFGPSTAAQPEKPKRDNFS